MEGLSALEATFFCHCFDGVVAFCLEKHHGVVEPQMVDVVGEAVCKLAEHLREFARLYSYQGSCLIAAETGLQIEFLRHYPPVQLLE